MTWRVDIVGLMSVYMYINVKTVILMIIIVI